MSRNMTELELVPRRCRMRLQLLVAHAMMADHIPFNSPGQGALENVAYLEAVHKVEIDSRGQDLHKPCRSSSVKP
jgi:hypothetical protein